MRSSFLLAMAGLALAAPMVAQQEVEVVAPWHPRWTEARPSPTSTVLALPAGQLEILGLRRWTPARMQDSLDRRAPGEFIGDPAVALPLRRELGFAEAVSAFFPAGEGTVRTVVLAVIEPEDSARTRHRLLSVDTAVTDRRAPWTPLVKLAAARPKLVERIAIARATGRLRQVAPEVPPYDLADTVVYRATWAVLDSLQTPETLAEARRILATAPYVYDRFAALAILSSFVEQDAAWHGFVGALLEVDGPVREAAKEILVRLTPLVSREVDWAPAAPELRAALDGGALPALADLLQLLVATRIDPEVAGRVLKGGGYAVRLYAGAQHPAFHEPALAFLRQVSGKDFGADFDRWSAWLAAL